MVLNCKNTNQPVAVIMDGMAYVTANFCHSQHVVNHVTIPVCETGLQERISELESE
jgi:hypothetical protein